ncbi:MAG: hypothetical protein ABI409_09150 [Ramlibacter sp.]
MKTISAFIVGAIALLTSGFALAQAGNMMNGGTWGSGWMGGYGGVWTPILLVVVIVGVIAWIVTRGRK